MLAAFAPNASAADNVRPVVSKVSPTSATVGTQVVFTANYSDNDSGVVLCRLYVEFEDQGVMNLSGSVASLEHTFVQSGAYTVFVYCKDAAGNAANGPNTSVLVTAASSGDTTPPTVSAISPTSAAVGAAVTLHAAYSDAGGVSSCRLIVNGFDQGAMTLSNGTASRSYTFDATGSFPAYAQCADLSGNAGAGPIVSIVVSASAPPPPPPAPVVTPGLVKLACPGGELPSDPCRAVYYRASDGTRHAFPNEKIYFTWYVDFSSVETVSPNALANLSLGSNVTYRPGVRMVKFVTDPKTYAVGRAGLLRWVSSESIATQLYGSAWNTKIDDLSDAFAADYSFGNEITNAAQFSPAAQTAATPTIDDNF